jgi:GDPmannose 4,6-dehydratase
VWIGEGLDEVGIDANTNRAVIRVDPKYFRPAEVETLLGDASKAKEKLGWEPKIGLREGIESTYNWYKEQIVKEKL